MDWTRMMRGARAILDDCASVKAGEQVLIVTDTELFEIGRTLEVAAFSFAILNIPSEMSSKTTLLSLFAMGNAHLPVPPPASKIIKSGPSGTRGSRYLQVIASYTLCKGS